MINQYPNCWLTLLLGLILFPPFTLKTLNPRFEPYPAIILPSGAMKTNANAREVSFSKKSIWGKHEKNNTWTKIDLETFLKPIPRYYFSLIVENSLGVKLKNQQIINSPQGFKARLKEFINKNLNNKVTPSEVNNTKYWWQQQLIQHGYAANEIMIVYEKVKFDVQTGQIISKKRTHETIFRLD